MESFQHQVSPCFQGRIPIIGETHRNFFRIKHKLIEESCAKVRKMGLGSQMQSYETGIRQFQLKIQAQELQESFAEVSPIIFEEFIASTRIPSS